MPADFWCHHLGMCWVFEYRYQADFYGLASREHLLPCRINVMCETLQPNTGHEVIIFGGACDTMKFIKEIFQVGQQHAP